MISAEKKDEFHRLYKEFVGDYFSQARGQKHLRRYDEARARGRANFEEIKEEARRHGVPTEKVLQRLLPHIDSSAHRNSGAWIHVAPTIQGDIRVWFEAAGWTKAEDWPKVAGAILNFLQTCSDNPSKISSACCHFVSLPYTTGLQTGMLTPILNALRPDDFMIINNKSRKVINYFTESHLASVLQTTQPST
jgi:5-methylcytosine-specific restriction enzyme B